MEIELLRDIVIIVSGLVVTLVAILLAVVSYSAYRRVNSILKFTETAAKKIETLTLIANDDMGKPLIQLAGIVQGIAYGIRGIKRVFKKGE